MDHTHDTVEPGETFEEAKVPVLSLKTRLRREIYRLSVCYLLQRKPTLNIGSHNWLSQTAKGGLVPRPSVLQQSWLLDYALHHPAG